jgi:N-methylhydantoinase A
VVWYERGRGHIDTPIFDGATYAAGHRLDGPAIVEFADTTLVVRPGQEARMTLDGTVVVRLPHKTADE